MEKNYKFVRGEHPNELSAYLLAEDIAKILRRKGRGVEVEDVDPRKTNIWHARQLVAGKKLKPHISFRQGYMRAVRNPFSVFFNFHNTHWNGNPPEKLKFIRDKWGGGNPHCYSEKIPNYFIVELPAIRSKKDENLNEGLKMLDRLMQKSKARWYADMGVNASYYESNPGYASFVDIETSKKAGLMSNKLMEFYATNIDNIAIEYFDELSAYGF